MLPSLKDAAMLFFEIPFRLSVCSLCHAEIDAKRMTKARAEMKKLLKVALSLSLSLEKRETAARFPLSLVTSHRGSNDGSEKCCVLEVLRPLLSVLGSSFSHFLTASVGGTATTAPIQHRVETGGC